MAKSLKEAKGAEILTEPAEVKELSSSACLVVSIFVGSCVFEAMANDEVHDSSTNDNRDSMSAFEQDVAIRVDTAQTSSGDGRNVECLLMLSVTPVVEEKLWNPVHSLLAGAPSNLRVQIRLCSNGVLNSEECRVSILARDSARAIRRGRER